MIRSAEPATQTRAYLVRLGCHAQVGRCLFEGPSLLVRNQKVLCRTVRGLEAGVVLTQLSGTPNVASRAAEAEADGQILRSMNSQDLWLEEKLQQTAQELRETCDADLARIGSSVALLEIEPLMDGQTVFFHFLGEVGDTLNQWSQRWAEQFQAMVSASRWAQLLEHGCGPGCGTDEASGCGSDGDRCAGCGDG